MGQGGYIYVLTNPSFSEYVKIGYADNVDERVNQLNRTECTPFAFRKYATLKVASRLADKNIHKLIDKFKPELRAKENVNGKMRIREFFAMTAQEAVEMLATIGSIYGEEPQIFEQTIEEKKEQIFAEKVKIESERKSPFSFFKCGIREGENIVFVNDPTIICTVAGDREIKYQSEIMSLSALAKKILNKNTSIQGTLYFTYNGEVLSALRKRLEDEGRYDKNFSNYKIIEKSTISEDINKKDEILFFVMKKYPAICKRINSGYLILKGSQIAANFTPSCRSSIKKLREKYSNCISSDYILTDDILVGSSSTAAEFVSGSSKNGKYYWRNKEGKLLKDILMEEQ